MQLINSEILRLKALRSLAALPAHELTSSRYCGYFEKCFKIALLSSIFNEVIG
ncbi:Uncharacterised protein [Serratia grimesii]|nr:Uncharacterised protein [Serratia grimesii]SMZ56337.1 Uncharacterised protein [Serratia grimesii]